MKKLLFIFLFTYSIVFSQVEYKYDKEDPTLPQWVKEMYSENSYPGKIELLYKNYYQTNKFVKTKHTQYYKRWKRLLSREISLTEEYKSNYQKRIGSGLPEWECVGPFDFDRVVSPEVMEKLNEKYNLDAPLYKQYFDYLGSAIQGDFGPSFRYPGRTVTEMIAIGLPITFELAIYSILFATFLGITFGSLAALKQNTLLDYIPPKEPLL